MRRRHLTDLLRKREGMDLSCPTVRRILVKADIGSPRSRRSPQHRFRRRRMPQKGMLVQIDGSQHPLNGGTGVEADTAHCRGRRHRSHGPSGIPHQRGNTRLPGVPGGVPRQAALPFWRQLDLPVHLLFLTLLLVCSGGRSCPTAVRSKGTWPPSGSSSRKVPSRSRRLSSAIS